MIKRSRGVNTTKQVERVSRLGGAFGQLVDTLLASALIGEEHEHTRDSKTRWERFRDDIQSGIEDFNDDGLFQYCPPRAHTAFPNISRICSLKNPFKLGKVLKFLSCEMDMWENIRISEQ
jgi:hypothetical protein